MLRLVQANLAATGKRNAGDGSPPLLLDGGTRYAPFRQALHFGRKVFAHEVELMAAVVFGRVKRRFGWGQSEDQPSVAGVDRCESEHVAEEGAVGLCILAVDDDMCARNHDAWQCNASTIAGLTLRCGLNGGR
jgi:hypothetical protein